MKPATQATRAAWQPFTPRGIAAFAQARFGRLLAVQLVVALVAAGAIAWFVQTAWCPIVTAGISRLPEQGEIRGGQLDWHGPANQVLAENRFLALTIDLEHAGEVRSPAHVQLELGRHDLQIQSLLGFTRISYWHGWSIPCNRIDLTPWWGAWRPPLLALLMGGVTISLILAWALLASLYFIPGWLIGLFANRDLSLLGSWRLSAAALMPGAVLMIAATAGYRWGMVEVVGLIVTVGLHLVVDWGYLVASVLCVERHPSVTSLQSNPFIAAPDEKANATTGAGTPMPDPPPGPPGQT